jgi:hypothetical protein
MALDPETFTRFGMPIEQAKALAEAIEDRHRAPDLFTLNVKTGINLLIAREICEQIVGGIGRTPPLVQWGMNLDLAEAIADAISTHSAWRPHGLDRPKKADLANA